jgi:hypothetical protein
LCLASVPSIHPDRQALGVSNRRSFSPKSTYFDHIRADDTETFDPELASIALRSTKTSSFFPSRMGEGELPHEVIVNVQWRYHPSERDQKTLRWSFHINRVCLPNVIDVTAFLMSVSQTICVAFSRRSQML